MNTNCPYDDLKDTSHLELDNVELLPHDVLSCKELKTFVDLDIVKDMDKRDVHPCCNRVEISDRTTNYDEATVASTPNEDDLWTTRQEGCVSTVDKCLVDIQKLEISTIKSKVKNTSENEITNDFCQEEEKVNRKLFYDDDDDDDVKYELSGNEALLYQTPKKNKFLDTVENVKNYNGLKNDSRLEHAPAAKSNNKDLNHTKTSDNEGIKVGVGVQLETNSNSVRLQDLWDAAKDVIDALYLNDNHAKAKDASGDPQCNSVFDESHTVDEALFKYNLMHPAVNQIIHDVTNLKSLQETWKIQRKPLKSGGSKPLCSDACSEATEMGTELQYKTPKKKRKTKRSIQTTIVLPSNENHRCEILSSSPSTIHGKDNSLDDSDVFSSIDSATDGVYESKNDINTQSDGTAPFQDEPNDSKKREVPGFQDRFSPFEKRCADVWSNGSNGEMSFPDNPYQSRSNVSSRSGKGNQTGYQHFNSVESWNQESPVSSRNDENDDDSFHTGDFPSPIWSEYDMDYTQVSPSKDKSTSIGTSHISLAFTNAKALLESLQQLHVSGNRAAMPPMKESMHDIYKSHCDAKVALETMKNECTSRLEKNIKIISQERNEEPKHHEPKARCVRLEKQLHHSTIDHHAKETSSSSEIPVEEHTNSISSRIAQLRQRLNI